MKVIMRAIIPFVILAAVACPAVAGDWKYFGSATTRGIQQHCFYDTETVSFQAAGHSRVWAECLAETEMDAAVAEQQDEAIINQSATLYSNGDLPPVTAFMHLSTDQIVSVIMYEQTANYGAIEPMARGYWELDCPARMSRMLDLSLPKENKFSHRPMEWKATPPDTNGDRLLKLVCR
jgi:hypothetical protein